MSIVSSDPLTQKHTRAQRYKSKEKMFSCFGLCLFCPPHGNDKVIYQIRSESEPRRSIPMIAFSKENCDEFSA